MYFAYTSVAGAPVLDTDQPSNQVLHQAKTQAEVRLLRSACASIR